MGGTKFTAASITMLLGTLLGSPAGAQTEAPVVGLKQPISVVGYSCSCKSCKVGLLCGGKGCAEAVTPAALCDTAAGALSACDTSACDDAGCDTPSCDTAGCDSLSDATPGCAAAYTDFDAVPSACDSSGAGCDTAGSGTSSCWLQCDASGCDSICSIGTSSGCSCCKSKRGCANCLNLSLCDRDGWWIRTEAIMWWTPNNSVPALATSSPTGTPLGDIGVLGLPSTTVLSSDSLFDDMRAGGRVRIGKWANCGLGFDSSGWVLGNLRDRQQWQSNGDPGLAIPFNNVDPINPGPDSELVAADGILAGTITINSSSEIYGGDAGVRKNLYCCSNPCSEYSYRVDGYLGYRHFRVREGLRIAEQLETTGLGGPIVLGTRTDLYDDFQTRNEFHGGNIGMVAMVQRGRWSTEVVSRLAFGNLDREVRIDGQTTITVPGVAPDVRPGGILTQPTNIGVYQDSDFAVLPEVQLNLGYTVSNHTRLLVGYTFMYLGDIVRPGDVIDTNVNGTLLDQTVPFAGPARPRFAWNDSTMWLMGLSLGAEFQF